jgi:hypothetical protein
MNIDAMDDDEQLRRVADYADKTGAKGLTRKKVWDRATLVKDADRPGGIVFYMERHEEILGVYRRDEGMAMRSFITRWPRYAFDPEAESLEVVGKQRESTATVDSGSAAEYLCSGIFFSFEPAKKDGKHKCREVLTGRERIVSDAAGAEAFAAEVVRAFDTSHDEKQLEAADSHTADEAQQTLSEIRDLAEDEAKSEARQAWERYNGTGF